MNTKLQAWVRLTSCMREVFENFDTNTTDPQTGFGMARSFRPADNQVGDGWDWQ